MIARYRAPLLVLVLAGLTLHTLVLMVLFGVLGVPARYITVLSAWKEGLVGVVALALIALALLARRRAGFRWTWTDILAGLLLVLVLADGALTAATSHLLPTTAILYGLRFYLVPLAAYAVGRLLPLGRRDLTVLFWAITLIAAATGVVALGERLLTDRAYVDLVESLGYRAYFGDYVHQALAGPGPTGAATWVDAGRGVGRRAGSVYLVSKPYGLALLVAIPATLALLHRELNRNRRWVLHLSAALIGLGLALTYTRAAIVVGIAVAILVDLLVRSWKVLPAIFAGLLLGLGLFYVETTFVNSPFGLRPNGLSAADMARLSLNAASDEEHFTAWAAALKSGLHKPVLGWGPGAANEDSGRFVSSSSELPITLGAESVFLQVFEELGMVGSILYLAIFALIARAAWGLYRRSPPDDPAWLQGVVMFSLTLGVVAIGFTTPIWSGAFVLTYAYWWLAGLTVQWAASESSSLAKPEVVVPNKLVAP